MATDYVYIPKLISDEFGVPVNIVREQMALGAVEIDGAPVTDLVSDGLVVPVKDLDGKEVFVKGPDRSFRMKFDADRYFGD